MFGPIAAPEPLALRGPVAALTIDAQRRRIFAAGARSVAVVDADSGKLLATVRIGGARSLALEPLGGHLFVGTSDGRISEIDPDRKSIVRSLDAGGAVEVLGYDAVSGRLYADGGGRTALAAFDARTFTGATPIALPGGMPGRFAADPVTRELYTAFTDRPGIAVVDPQHATVRASFSTPGLPGDGIVRFDDALGQIVVLGGNGILDIYDRAGTRRARITVPAAAGCDLDTGIHVVACTGPGGLTFVQLRREAAPLLLGTSALAGPAVVALDAKTDDAVVVQSKSDGGGVVLERWRASSAPLSPAPNVQ